MVAFDYSLKVKKLNVNKAFPRLVFPGLAKHEFSLVPYSEGNIANVRDRKSTIASLRNHEDDVSRENAFLFAEGFNDVGFCVEVNEEDGLYAMAKDSIVTVFSDFPGNVSYNCGKYAAIKSNEYQLGAQISSAVFSPTRYFDIKIDFTGSFLHQINTATSSRFGKNGIIPREDTIELFRKGSEEKDFIYLLPIIELFASLVEDGYSPSYIFPTFIGLNEFLEHGNNNECFVDYFDNIDNATEVANQFNNIKVKRYEHTDKIMESMILPHRLLSNEQLENSIVRKAISERKKATLKTAVYLNKPIPQDKNASSDTIARRIRKLFDTIEMLKELNVSIHAGNNEELILTDMRKHNDSTYRTDRIEKFFDQYLKDNHASLRTAQVINYLVGASSNEVCNFIIRTIDEDEYGNIQKHHLATILYAICFPRSINEYSSARVALIIDYALKGTNYNVDFVCDVIMQLLVNFDSSELSINDWKTVVDYHNSSLNPRQVVNVVAMETQRAAKNPKHENNRLEHIVEIYNDKRSIL